VEQPSTLRRKLLLTRRLFFPSWPLPQPSGSSGHSHIPPCQGQHHPRSAPSRWGFWVACGKSYVRASNTRHHDKGNAAACSRCICRGYGGSAGVNTMSHLYFLSGNSISSPTFDF